MVPLGGMAVYPENAVFMLCRCRLAA